MHTTSCADRRVGLTHPQRRGQLAAVPLRKTQHGVGHQRFRPAREQSQRPVGPAVLPDLPANLEPHRDKIKAEGLGDEGGQGVQVLLDGFLDVLDLAGREFQPDGAACAPARLQRHGIHLPSTSWQGAAESSAAECAASLHNRHYRK
jgi:hypothetical protein